MSETTDPNALLNPGDSATAFFDFDFPLPAFETSATTVCSRTNAMWLMELCRLVYRNDNMRPSRAAFLTPRSLHETKFFSANATQAYLVLGPAFAVLAFRGTLGGADWLSDFAAFTVNWEGEGKVHNGFNKQLDDVWGDVTSELDKLQVPTFYTGHSLGAALATLAVARRFIENKDRPAALYTFGSPRLGTTSFQHAFPANFLHCRVVNDLDIVPTVPPRTTAIGAFLPSYHHVGTLHQIDHDGHLHKGRPNNDEDITTGPFQQTVKNAKDLAAHFVAFTSGKHIKFPEQFTDHAPINYSARIERTGDFR